MSRYLGYKAVKAYDGTFFQMPALDLLRASQLTANATSVAQGTATNSEFVMIYASGNDARIAFGENPIASAAAGSLPIKAGSFLSIIKLRTDKIAVIGVGGEVKVDIVPAMEIYGE